MGRGTTLFFSNDTQFKSLTTGDIVASNNPPAVYASTSKAGLVQLATPEIIEGARGLSSLGISDKVVVTALDLARELNVRLNNSVVSGDGVTVVQTSTEAPGGDPSDSGDDITQFTVNIGLPLNDDDVTFNGLKLGSTSGHKVTSITNAISTTDPSVVRSLKLVTEQSLFTNGWVNSDQLASGSVLFNKVNSASYITQVQGGVRVEANASDAIFATEKAIAKRIDAVAAAIPVIPPTIKGWMRIAANGSIVTQGGALAAATVSKGDDTSGVEGSLYTITVNSGIPGGSNVVCVATPQDSDADHVLCIQQADSSTIKVKTIDLEQLPSGSTTSENDSTIHLMVMY
jgi:hypothetical protein